MTLKFSTRAINLSAGYKPTVTDAGSQISFTAPNLINTTQNDFLIKGFRPGRVIEVVDGGSSTNAGLYKIASVTAGVITVGSGIVTEAAAVDTPTINQMDTGSWINIFQYSVMGIYGSPTLTDPDATEGATLLALVTDGGGAVVPGSSTNGLLFTFDAAGNIVIDASQTWKASAGLVDGTAYFAIIYDNGYITGDDSTNLRSARILMTLGTSGSDADMIVTTLSVKTTTPFEVQSGNLTLPAVACS